MIHQKRGRPAKDNARVYRYNVRVTEEEHAMLDKIAVKTGLSKSNILRAALRLYYSMRFE